MRQFFKKQFGSEFNRNVAKVFSGTFLAQIIAIGISPILTRIYTPEDFSNLALYLSVVSILTVVVTFKYDKAIILPKDDKDALALVILSMIITLIISLLFFIAYVVCGSYLEKIFKVEGIGAWLIFVPITILARAMYTILNTWFNRKKQYTTLSKNRVFTSSMNGGLKIGFQTLAKMGAFGLVLSEAMSQVAALVLFGRKFWKEQSTHVFTLTKLDIKRIAKTYRSFPIFSLPADFLSIFSRELPVLMLSGYFGAGVVGQFSLTKRTLDAPFTLLSTSILEVFKQKATEDFHKKGNCRSIFVSTFIKLILISIIPFLILYIIAPDFFAFVFGAKWRIAGEFARILAIMYFFKFISSPLSYVFFIFNKLALNLYLQAAAILMHLLFIYLGYHYFGTKQSVIYMIALSFSIVYIFYLIISYVISGGTQKITS